MPHERIIDLLIRAEASLRAARVTDSPRLDAEVLLAEVLHLERSRLIASYTDWLGPNVIEMFFRRLERRLHGEPVSYIIGRREFMGLSFLVDSRVLIPRPETEILVEHVVEMARKREISSILDLGTGSGCIAVSLAVFLPQAAVYATDVSPGALEVARQNAERHSVSHRIRFFAGPYYEPLPALLRGSIDTVVSNPPYIPDSEYPLLQKNVREYEPAAALRGGPDGLIPFRQIACESPEWLALGGATVVEIGEGQADPAVRIMRGAGLEVVEILPDLAGKQRVIVGRKANE